MKSSSAAKPFLAMVIRKNILSCCFLLFSLAAFAQRNQLVTGCNQFAFDFYRNSTGSGKNVCISPLSLYTMLGLVYEGSRDSTAKQMSEVLYLDEDKPNVSNAFSGVLSELSTEECRQHLVISNALWVQQKFLVSSEYRNVATGHYHAYVQSVNFFNDVEAARQQINEWSDNNTNRLVPEILPKGSVTTDTRAVITNAIYFASDWMKPFDAAFTNPGEFYVSKTQRVAAQFMNMKSTEFEYYADHEVALLTIPYAGLKYSMVLLLPSGSMQDFESQLSYERFKNWKDKTDFIRLDKVSIPKFKFEQNVPAMNVLKSMGLTLPFSGEYCDLSGITGDRDLYISDVYHKTVIQVDEHGTTAAAATAAVADSRSLTVSTHEFIADKPFVFMLIDNDTECILFIGKVSNPE